MKSRLLRAAFAAAFTVMSAVGLSCDVNDYCLNCGDKGDGGNHGDGGDGDSIDSNMDDGNDGGCIPSGVEVCDNKDNDCDGNTDEGQLPTIGDQCTNQMGECAGGVKQCVNGAITCTKPPMAESCDNKDNDCDGVADDGDPGGGLKCGTDFGECVAGTQHCVNGAITCVGAVGGITPPFGSAEICDGKDNDCNNVVDDNPTGIPATFCDGNNNTGLCKKGVPTCVGGSVICVGVVGPTTEVCDNMDQDCDGNNTNGFQLQTDPTNCGTCNNVCNLPHAVEGCSGGMCTVLACDDGYHDNNLTAGDGCEFGPCTITGNEVCDGVDNDCDGLVDMADPDLVVPPVASMCRTINECAGATVQCMGVNGFRCNYPDPDVSQTNGVIQAETKCDTLDNDCDGAFDEGQPGLGNTCTRGQGECQTTGVLACDAANLNGPAICNAANPGTGSTEVCDGKDNNCDGIIDNNAATGNLSGQDWVNIPGIAGTQMMKFEASHPDATASVGGTITTHVCSRTNTVPWTNVTYPQAVAACSAIGARLCTEAEWQRMCVPPVTYPVAGPATAGITDFTFIEAEDATTNATVGGKTWALQSPLSFNGVTAVQVADAGAIVSPAANAFNNAPRLDFQLNLNASTAYTVWTRMRSPNVGSPLRGDTAGTATSSPAAPAATQVGDLVIVATWTVNTTNAAISHNLQAGFTSLVDTSLDDGNNDGRISVAYKVATAAGAQTYQAFTTSGGTTFSAVTVLKVGMFDLNLAIGRGAAFGNNNQPPDPVAPLAAGTVSMPHVMFAIGAWNNGGSTTVNASAPFGFTELSEMSGSLAGELSIATASFQAGTNVSPPQFFDNNPGNTGSAAATIAIGLNRSMSAWVGLTAGTSPGAANAQAISTSSDDNWQWVASPTITTGAAGTYTFSVFMRDDGVLVDEIAVARQATDGPTFDNSWSYEMNPRTPQPTTCNADDFDTAPPVAISTATESGFTATFTTATAHRLTVGGPVVVSGVNVGGYNGTWTVATAPSATVFTAVLATNGLGAGSGGTANGDQDDVVATGSLSQCHVEKGADDSFDMSGNVKEWALARSAGFNPLRGGSANNEVNGTTCKLDFSSGDNTFFFPNVGFRCCR